MEKETIRERLALLRQGMSREGLDAWLAADADCHGSEYVGEHFKTRTFLSGFTGSAGTLLVLPDSAGLWTDSRYWIQAEQELADTGIDLFRSGEKTTPTVQKYLAEKLPEGGRLGFDGRTFSGAYCQTLRRQWKKGELRSDLDLPDAFWTDRPALPDAPAFLLEERYAGQSAAEKLAKLRQELAKRDAAVFLLTALDDLAWLFNLRGGDVAYNPVLLAYAAVTPERALLFTDESKLSDGLRASLAGLGTEIRPYDGVYDFCRETEPGCRVMLDTRYVNQSLCSILEDRGAERIDIPNPTALWKSIKNDTEQANMRLAHEKDGAALTKWLYQVKRDIGRVPMTECSVGDLVDELRRQQGALGPSFATIAGYGPHGAIVHYEATAETDVPLQPEGLLLLDSGGQYPEGTTDVTRTVALGPVTEEQKRHVTLVLRGMLALADAVFPAGTRAEQLEAVARLPLWGAGLDYGHGTGHGVGCFLCVHEGPVNLRQRPLYGWDGVLRPGMILSDEPGYYAAGSHGVRQENLLLVCRAEREGYLRFEHLTLAPFDRDAVDPALLGEEGRRRLDAYHRQVYQTLAPRLTEEEARWLAEVTKPLETAGGLYHEKKDFVSAPYEPRMQTI